MNTYVSSHFQPLPRGSAGKANVSPSGLKKFYHDFAESTPHPRGAMVLRHGKVIGEKWFEPYRPEDKIWVYSMSKSFTTTAAGFAYTEGKLDLDAPVISFFPDQCPDQISDNLRAMKVRHLLSMNTGHSQDSTPSLVVAPDHDWIRAFLSLPVEHVPGTYFVYNSGASFMVDAIVEKVTGQPVVDYLSARLFEPLGFDDVSWDTSPNGPVTGGWGIMVRLEDMARLGQLYLNGGKWNGVQILSPEYVRMATSFQSDNSGSDNPDWAQGYGFQFWMCQHGAVRGDGAYGQFMIILPREDMVVALNSESFDLQAVVSSVWDSLLPCVDTVSSPKETWQAGTYRLENAPYGFESMTLTYQDDAVSLFFQPASAGTHQTEDGPQPTKPLRITAGRGEYALSEEYILFGCPLRFQKPVSLKQAVHSQYVRALFHGQDELDIDWMYVQSPHRNHMRMVFGTGADGKPEVTLTVAATQEHYLPADPYGTRPELPYFLPQPDKDGITMHGVQG